MLHSSEMTLFLLGEGGGGGCSTWLGAVQGSGGSHKAGVAGAIGPESGRQQ